MPEESDVSDALSLELRTLENLKRNAIDAISSADTTEKLAEVETQFLGKKGAIKGMLKADRPIGPGIATCVWRIR